MTRAILYSKEVVYFKMSFKPQIPYKRLKFYKISNSTFTHWGKSIQKFQKKKSQLQIYLNFLRMSVMYAGSSF